MKVLVTGIEGFTGRHLAEVLARDGHEVIGLSYKEPREPVPAVAEVQACDLLDAEGLKKVVERMQPDAVAHLAAISFVAHGSVADIYATNVVGTRNLLEALCTAGKPPQAVLLASSANVYGNGASGSIAETAAPSPSNDYAVSKLASEYVARLYENRLPVVITRPFNYTGVGQAEHFLLPKIVSHVRRRAHVIELGNLDVARDFSDVRVVVEYYRRLLATPAAAGQTFNVCSGTAWTLRDVVRTVCELADHEMEVHVNPAFVRANEVKLLQGDASRLVSAVGAVEPIPLPQTLRWMLESGG